MAEHQTLASGFSPSRSSKWGSLGGFTGRQVANLNSIFGFIVGQPGSGKSALIQSCPDSYTFNLDLSSTTVPGLPGGPPSTPQTVMWPGMSPSGPIDDNGDPIQLNWAHVEAKAQVLRDLARNNLPRPKILFFDSLSAMISLLKAWMPGAAPELGLNREAKSSWKELDGRAAWDLLYDKIGDLLADLKAHGYGVFLIGHIVNARVPIGEDKLAFMPELTITDNFWKRLYHRFEMVMVVQSVDQIVTIPDPRWRPNPAFPNAKAPSISTTQRRTVITTGGNDFSSLCKVRVPLTSVTLDPPPEAWSVFSKAYAEAASRGTLEVREVSPPPVVSST